MARKVVALGSLSDSPVEPRPRRLLATARRVKCPSVLHALTPCATRFRRWFSRNVARLRSFPVIYILVVNMVASSIFAISTGASIAGPVSLHNVDDFFYVFLILIASLGFFSSITLCYPLGGLLADVYYGRYRVIAGSVIILWCGIALSCLPLKFLVLNTSTPGPVGVALVFTLLAFIVGFSGFQANVVQFALDQLLESPSEHLSVFLHWFVWTGTLGAYPTLLVFLSLACHSGNPMNMVSLNFLPDILLIILSVTLCVGYCKRSTFLLEPGAGNPYKTVYRVLKFAKRHKYPILRSAVTYGEDEPSRIDFGKAKYGGPFTTEEVEDVKTFLRIVGLLFCIGPIFTLQVATDSTFPLFGIHVGLNKPFSVRCTADWMFFQSGFLTHLLVIVFLPVYICFVYSFCQRRLPRILTRLGVGMIFCVLSLISMLVIEVIGYNTTGSVEGNGTADVGNCFFIAEVRNDSDHPFAQTFNFDSSVLLVPNVLNAIGPTVVYITMLEFVSAQSPHNMKGLLVGMFFAVRGLFTLLGLIALYPIAISYHHHSIRHIGLSCGTFYYTLLVVVGVCTLLLYRVVVRRYRFRRREEEPFNQIYIENYYEHHSPQTNRNVTNSFREQTR